MHSHRPRLFLIVFAAAILTVTLACKKPKEPSPPGPSNKTAVISLTGGCYSPFPNQFVEIRVFKVNALATGVVQWGTTYTKSNSGSNTHEIDVPQTGDFSFTVRVELTDTTGACCTDASPQNPKTAVFTHEETLGPNKSSYLATLTFQYCK
jgi:hypothetical protein